MSKEGDEAIFHQKENGRWEWLEPRNAYFLGPVDGSICTFETKEDAANDRAEHVAAPVDNFGRRIRSREAILHLLRIAAASEIGCDASTLEIVWRPRDQAGNNWNVESEESLDAIWDIVTLLQATYSIPERGERRAVSHLSGSAT